MKKRRITRFVSACLAGVMAFSLGIMNPNGNKDTEMVASAASITSTMNLSVKYRVHCAKIGWQSMKNNGDIAGTVGQSRRMESFDIGLVGGGRTDKIQVQSHLANSGWGGWTSTWNTMRAVSGTTGQCRAMEAIRLKLAGPIAQKYDILYRVHVQNIGWMPWKQNGETAGTTGRALQMEAIQVTIMPKSTYVSNVDILNAASNNGVSLKTAAFNALNSINTKYQNSISKSAANVLLFEGCGNNASTSKRENAMCVVVKNKKIVYVNRYSSTIPDSPFNPSLNSGTAMPTLKSGIYNYTTVNHRGQYAALNVQNAQVVRFKNKSSYYNSTSSAINIHRKSSDAARKSNWVNSSGCLLIGRTGVNQSGEYARFIQAVGIVNSNARGDAKYRTTVRGKVIVDRSNASQYMKNIGYSQAAIKAIG